MTDTMEFAEFEAMAIASSDRTCSLCLPESPAIRTSSQQFSTT